MKGVTATCFLGFITLCLIARNVCHAWTFSVSPNRVIENDPNDPTFFGNGSDYFKILTIDDNSVLIGAKNNVYNLSLTRLNENRDNRIEWTSSEAHREMCVLKGKNNSDCQNYIRIYARVADQQVMLCGTNSFKPMCRYYKLNAITSDGSLFEMKQEFEGEAISPYSPTQNNTYIHTDLDELYSATSVGFAGSQQLIYRQRLLGPAPNSYTGSQSQQTLRTDFRNDILNQASFVSALEYNSFILFFFREQAMEYQNCGKSMYTRVARVCKNDKGGSHPFHDRFSSFLKTRLNCSMPGEYPFYFDELQATSEVIRSENDVDALLYTVMNTNDNAIDGSAICVYSMNSITGAFEGKFKNQRDVNSVWRALDDSEVPQARPGQCVDDSRTLPSSTINFVLKNPLMDGVVNPIHEAPLLVHTGSNYKFTAIAVDPKVETINGKSYDVIFIGTDNGNVLKLINAGSSEVDNKPVVVSEQQVLPMGTRIKELKISRATQTLIVVSDNFVRSIPLHDCPSMIQCSQCVGSRDPYCLWDNKNRDCIFYNKLTTKNDTSSFIESIDGKNDNFCGDGIIPTVNMNMNHHPKINSGTVTSYSKTPLTSEVEIKKETEEFVRKHKYDIAVMQAPSLQSTSEYFEPQIQTSSASIVLLFVIAALIIGIIGGFTLSKCVTSRDSARSSFPFGASTDSHHRNHLGWPTNTNKHLLQLPTMNNGGKDINLLMNTNTSTINNINKKDNLELEFSLGSKDRTHECKNSNESLDKETCKSAVISASGGTLQKVKKTYI